MTARPGRILRHAADWRSLAVVAAALTVMGLEWSGLHHPLLWCLSLVLVYPCFLINHNHQHLPVFTRRAPNHVFDLALTLATGLRVSLIIPLHNRNHHAANNGPGDFMATTRVRWRHPALRLLAYPFAAAAAWAPHKAGMMRAIARDEPWLHRRLLAQRLVLLAACGVLVALRPLPTILVVFLPWMLCHYWMMTANYIQHEGCDASDPDRHSRDFTGSLLNWYTFNGGFHTVHHERPHLHWSALPAAHAERCQHLSPHLIEPVFPLALWRLATGTPRRSAS
jgi:fatty acid desaturase